MASLALNNYFSKSSQKFSILGWSHMALGTHSIYKLFSKSKRLFQLSLYRFKL